ncbi:MAG: hypothetical protein MUD01_03115 [Chloroflexaceae bacterium]|nr:hypothetical protein [Chloroflexaceae bacterium]
MVGASIADLVGFYLPRTWLEDHKGRVLSFDDIRHYGRMVAALRVTQRVMAESGRIAL